MKIKVLCCGNLLRGDDGVGIHVYNQLRRSFLPPDVELIDAGTSVLRIFPCLEGADKIIFIDALRYVDTLKTGCKERTQTGRIWRLSERNLKESDRLILSGHDCRLEWLLEAIRHSFEKVPQIIVFGIEVERINHFTNQLTPEVKRVIPKVLKLILKEVKG